MIYLILKYYFLFILILRVIWMYFRLLYVNKYIWRKIIENINDVNSLFILYCAFLVEYKNELSHDVIFIWSL